MKSPTLNLYRSLACLMLALSLTFSTGTLLAEEPEEEINKLAAAALENRIKLDYDGQTFSGPGWEHLLERGKESQFFMIGEEHGIAENPKLAAQLFTALVPAGYEKLAIEISPPMAAILDRTVKQNGLDGLRKLYGSPGGEPAFFGMKEEAELLVAARAALPEANEVFWGVDYEVGGGSVLIRELQTLNPPVSAEEPLNRLVEASEASWASYQESGNITKILMFSGDPELASAVTDAWPNAGTEAAAILNSLQSTMEINQAWVQGRRWESNARRAAFFRSSFLDHWHAARRQGNSPKTMVKLGGNHLVRGRNNTGTFDLGSLLPEIAEVEGTRTFSILVLPGADSLTAVLNPVSWTFEAKPAKDNYAGGLEPLTAAAFSDAFTLIDLAALRPIIGSSTRKYGVAAARVIHGFDMLLVMSGSTASTDLEHN